MFTSWSFTVSLHASLQPYTSTSSAMHSTPTSPAIISYCLRWYSSGAKDMTKGITTLFVVFDLLEPIFWRPKLKIPYFSLLWQYILNVWNRIFRLFDCSCFGFKQILGLLLRRTTTMLLIQSVGSSTGVITFMSTNFSNFFL